MKRKRSVVSLTDILDCSQQQNNNQQQQFMLNPLPQASPIISYGNNNSNPHSQHNSLSQGHNHHSLPLSQPNMLLLPPAPTQSLKDIISGASNRNFQSGNGQILAAGPSSGPRMLSPPNSQQNRQNLKNPNQADVFDWQILLSKMELVENRIGCVEDNVVNRIKSIYEGDRVAFSELQDKQSSLVSMMEQLSDEVQKKNHRILEIVENQHSQTKTLLQSFENGSFLSEELKSLRDEFQNLTNKIQTTNQTLVDLINQNTTQILSLKIETSTKSIKDLGNKLEEQIENQTKILLTQEEHIKVLQRTVTEIIPPTKNALIDIACSAIPNPEFPCCNFFDNQAKFPRWEVSSTSNVDLDDSFCGASAIPLHFPSPEIGGSDDEPNKDNLFTNDEFADYFFQEEPNEDLLPDVSIIQKARDQDLSFSDLVEKEEIPDPKRRKIEEKITKNSSTSQFSDTETLISSQNSKQKKIEEQKKTEIIKNKAKPANNLSLKVQDSQSLVSANSEEPDLSFESSKVDIFEFGDQKSKKKIKNKENSKQTNIRKEDNNKQNKEKPKQNKKIEEKPKKEENSKQINQNAEKPKKKENSKQINQNAEKQKKEENSKQNKKNEEKNHTISDKIQKRIDNEANNDTSFDLDDENPFFSDIWDPTAAVNFTTTTTTNKKTTKSSSKISIQSKEKDSKTQQNTKKKRVL